MQTISEPQRHKSSCPYCGDAPVNHTLFYISSLLSTHLDNHMTRVVSRAPVFFINFIDWMIFVFSEVCIFFGIIKLSHDVTKAKTFRSRVTWEEANRRGIKMEQLVMLGKYLDQYRAVIGGKKIYFTSLPIPEKLLRTSKNWDDKFVLKEALVENHIPVPSYVQFRQFLHGNLENIFNSFTKPIIVKPRNGSRGRHTVTNINTYEQFQNGVAVAGMISAYLVAEEHLMGDVCRATFVGGKLMGFYRGGSPFVIGDGVKTVNELIADKDRARHERVQKVLVDEELKANVLRIGFGMDDVPPAGLRISLTHRTGRLFGGVTKEMLDELHPSFVPILTKAAQVVGLPVIGFDVIIPEPTSDANSQKWGIIECNTLPFIDLHYYALEGKPKNIAGAIWDFWN
jgi:cyanophycin synthetase